MFIRVKNKPLVDYSNSQILTSNEHMKKLRRISEKKAMVQEKKAAKLRGRKLTKRKRAEEKVFEATTKRRRASELEARKLTKKIEPLF